MSAPQGKQGSPRVGHAPLQESKLLREFKRAYFKLHDPLSAIWDRVHTQWHDFRFDARVTAHRGEAPLGKKIAILLIYQPKYVANSVRFTISHLVANDYSVVIVANGGMRSEAIQTMLQDVAMVVVRPNFGHDFGGYRDGLKVIGGHLIKAKSLLLINDSIWFPLRSDDDLIRRMEAATTGLSGPMFECKANRRHKGHFESYMLYFGIEAITSQAFITYWKRYKITKVRRKVLRHGEKGLSRALLDAGVPSSILCSRQAFMSDIEEADRAFLRTTLTYAILQHPEEDRPRIDLLSEMDAGMFCDGARRFILRHAAKGNVQELFPYAAMTAFDLPFLKKRKKIQTQLMRTAYMQAVSDGQLPPADQAIAEEIMHATCD